MDSKLSPWLPAIAALAGISTFAATVFAYLDEHRKGMPGSYAPFIAGTVLLALIVGRLVTPPLLAVHRVSGARRSRPYWEQRASGSRSCSFFSTLGS
jgi:hypothetical protein